MPQSIGYSRTVILVHGLFRKASSMAEIDRAFRVNGYQPVPFEYPSWSQDITTTAHQLYDLIRMYGSRGSRVHLVTHSLGGMVVRRVLRLYGDDLIGAVVMMAPPNNGAAMARLATSLLVPLGPAGRELANQQYLDDLCAIPAPNACCVIAGTDPNWTNPTTWFGSSSLLWGPNDGTVSVEETRLLNTDLVTVEACHTWIPSHPEAIRLATDFVHKVCSTRGLKQQRSIHMGKQYDIKDLVRWVLNAIAEADDDDVSSLLEDLPSDDDREQEVSDWKWHWVEWGPQPKGWRIQENIRGAWSFFGATSTGCSTSLRRSSNHGKPRKACTTV